MKFTKTATFWMIMFSAFLGLLVGQIHWILGVMFFFMLVGKSLFTTLMIDTAYGVTEYHNDRADDRAVYNHDRNDERAKKEIASMILLKAKQSGRKIRKIN